MTWAASWMPFPAPVSQPAATRAASGSVCAAGVWPRWNLPVSMPAFVAAGLPGPALRPAAHRYGMLSLAGYRGPLAQGGSERQVCPGARRGCRAGPGTGPPGREAGLCPAPGQWCRRPLPPGTGETSILPVVACCRTGPVLCSAGDSFALARRRWPPPQVRSEEPAPEGLRTTYM